MPILVAQALPCIDQGKGYNLHFTGPVGNTAGTIWCKLHSRGQNKVHHTATAAFQLSCFGLPSGGDEQEAILQERRQRDTTLHFSQRRCTCPTMTSTSTSPTLLMAPDFWCNCVRAAAYAHYFTRLAMSIGEVVSSPVSCQHSASNHSSDCSATISHSRQRRGGQNQPSHNVCLVCWSWSSVDHSSEHHSCQCLRCNGGML